MRRAARIQREEVLKWNKSLDQLYCVEAYSTQSSAQRLLFDIEFVTLLLYSTCSIIVLILIYVAILCPLCHICYLNLSPNHTKRHIGYSLGWHRWTNTFQTRTHYILSHTEYIYKYKWVDENAICDADWFSRSNFSCCALHQLIFFSPSTTITITSILIDLNTCTYVCSPIN